MKTRILNQITSMFDRPQIQNNLRGLWVEVMIAELLGYDWEYIGEDWAGWDLTHKKDRTRIEIKSSAKMQTWGPIKSPPRFNIEVAQGHYPDGVTYEQNKTGERLAHHYIFAWHEDDDHRDVDQWQFFVVTSGDLPKSQKSIGLNPLRKLTNPISTSELRKTFETL